MITKRNFEEMIKSIGFSSSGDRRYIKYYKAFTCSITVDFNAEKIIYPEDPGIRIKNHSTCNFTDPENFVVLECVNRLLEKGYRPEHIELEKEWSLGHDTKGGRADICVIDKDGKMLFIIECKTAGNEYAKEYKNIYTDGGQLFSYWQQERSCQWLALYSSNFENNIITYEIDSIDCSDDANILVSAKKDPTIQLYRNAHTVPELYNTWDVTYEKRFCGDVLFRDDSQAYNIGVKPLRKVDLCDFCENDKIVNRFEEILRHNNVSDKENAFNRLVALFICKLVDEIQKSDNDVVEFQYKVGTDTYESLQDRLQRLHKEGMEKFMREEIFYVSDDYAEKLVQQYTGQKRQKMIDDLRGTLRILKFYTNNDFAFKDVHNEELFYQNGKILVEVIQLFQGYRIIGSADVQMLGDLFEQLLNKGFKQNEGQFFTPIPITRFIWDSLPLEMIIHKSDGIEYPKIIDYTCGAGHFLTQGFEAINACVMRIDPEAKIDKSWVESNVYGVEKDYRLARVSKISLFMHGAGDGNIVFGDGLENYPDKNITPGSFDILVANPPYSVKTFKPHLKLKDNSLVLLDKISNDGSEIETLFVERISQLVKPLGVAAVILPSSILNKENESFIGAREFLLKNFFIKAITQFGNKTFGATGTNTVIMFLQKFDEPPKRIDLIDDSISAIYENADIKDWEDSTIFRSYLKKIGITRETYYDFIIRSKDYTAWKEDDYFGMYYSVFITSSEYTTKTKQKGFTRASATEKMKWYNQHFYDYAFSIEKEKLLYFALVYKQSTLVVTAPDDNKKQETFLGYKWSNRKGQEGIQIIKAGGLLYKDTDRFDDMTMAGVIRNCFFDKFYDVPDIEEYYYHLRLQDMLDFSSVSFNKAIRTTCIRILKDSPNLTTYRLSDKSVFDIRIGDRVLSTEINEGGDIPVYSANVFEEFGRIDKQYFTNYSVPTILWGIDGDWMVNIIPANQPFYPTDHCGVLRIKSDRLLPNYMALALQVEGEFEKFTRYNRASTQRIQNLVIQAPEVNMQQKIMDEIECIDDQIEIQDKEQKSLLSEIRNEYTRLFSSAQKKNIPLREISNYFIGLTYKPENVSINGTAVLRSGNIKNSQLVFDDIVRVNSVVKETLFLKDNDILMCSRNGSARLIGKVALVSNLQEKMTFGTFMTVIRSQKYYSYLYMFFQSDEFKSQITNGRTMSINQITTQMLDKIYVPLPIDDLIVDFTKYYHLFDDRRIKLITVREQLIKERDELITKYFK